MAEPHPFKWRHFEVEITLLCVCWYLRVRHVTYHGILSETERTGRRFFGSTAHLMPEGKGNNRMLVKRGETKAS
jgi:hypothetical protein